MKQTKKQSLINPQAEKILRENILKDLANKGRKDYDKPHTEAVVFWMKKLVENLQLPFDSSQVLITAAYAHDWGYSRIQSMSESRDFSKMISFKKLHMQFGAEMIETLLYSKLAKLYTEQQKVKIIHLVSIHDKVRELITEEELTLMEADTLGMLDRSRLVSSLSPQDELIFLEKSIYNLRLPRFKHQFALDAANAMLTTHYSEQIALLKK